MRLYAPIQKIDAESRMVWGYASTEAVDDQGEVVTRTAIANALDDYMLFANIREMHAPSAVGVAKEADIDDRGLFVAAKIVDNAAWEKVREGVYKGFSIGGRVTARDPGNRKKITGLKLTEISVVDRPANPEAVFDCWKAAAPNGDNDMNNTDLGQTDLLASTAPAALMQIWTCGDHTHQHVRKSDAEACVTKRAADPAAPNQEPEPESEPEQKEAAADAVKNPAAEIIAKAEAELARAAAVAKPAESAAPPEGAPDAQASTVSKSLYDVSHVVNLLYELEWLKESLTVETNMQASGSLQPERLGEIIAELASFLRLMVQEGTNRLIEAAAGEEAPMMLFSHVTGDALGGALRKAIGDQADKLVPMMDFPIVDIEAHLRKIGARNSRSDMRRLEQMHNLCVELGAKCVGMETGKSTTPADLDKLGGKELAVTATGLVKRLLWDEDTQKVAGRIEDAHDALVAACGQLDIELPPEVGEPIERRYTPDQQVMLDMALAAGERALAVPDLPEAQRASLDLFKGAMVNLGAATPENASWTVALDSLAKKATDVGGLLAVASDCLTKFSEVDDYSRAVTTMLTEACEALGQCSDPQPPEADPVAKRAGTDDDLAKRLIESREENAQLLKVAGQLTETLAAMREQIEKIANTPLPPATAAELPPGIVMVSKADDGRRIAGHHPSNGGPSEEEVRKAWEGMSEQDRFMAHYAYSRTKPLKIAAR
ncbi:MAG: HK97 family phage prohead protease [Alphaproteobacteria bacterium]